MNQVCIVAIILASSIKKGSKGRFVDFFIFIQIRVSAIGSERSARVSGVTDGSRTSA